MNVGILLSIHGKEDKRVCDIDRKIITIVSEKVLTNFFKPEYNRDAVFKKGGGNIYDQISHRKT